jgi:hypothetical protein
MAGLEGVLIRKKNEFRVVLTMEMIMKSVMVEVEMSDIEPANSSSCATVPPWSGDVSHLDTSSLG